VGKGAPVCAHSIRIAGMADSEKPLPPNWRMARDSDGKAYYFNELTGETSWNFPSAPPVAATVVNDDDGMSPLSTGAVVANDLGGMGGMGGMGSSGGMDTMVGVHGAGGPRGGKRGMGDIFTPEGLPKLLLNLLAAFVLLVQAWIHLGQKPGDGSIVYAYIVGLISVLLTLFFLAYGRYKTEAFLTTTVKVQGNTYSLAQLFALFLGVWWTLAAFILTFYKPYSTPSNAYIACWLGFATAVLYAAGVHTRVETAFRSFSEISLTPSLTALGGCIAAAAVVFFVSLGYTGFWTGSFALVTSIIDFVLAGLTYFCIDTKRLGPQQTKGAASLLVLMWALSIFFLTFDLDVEKTYYEVPALNTSVVIDEGHLNAFTKGGNGFVATWAGMLCAFSFAYHEFVGIELNLKRTLRQSFSLRNPEASLQPSADAV